MTRDEFRNLLSQRLLVLDGATGTELAKRGMPQGVCPEKWVLENPQAIISTQGEYAGAGSDIVYSCTFGANPFKLEEFGLQDQVHEINRDLVKLSRKAVGENKFVFGDIAPTGQFIEPFGELSFDDAVAAYKKQVAGLLEGGVDGFVIETMMDIQEARAALIAVRELSDLPTMVTMTYGADGRTLTGTDPVTAVITLQSLGADAVGCNCSTGPKSMLECVKLMKTVATVPLVAKPNAGMPVLKDGKTVFDMSAETFGEFVPDFIKHGVNLMGGCCGTAPAYIAQIHKRSQDKTPVAPLQDRISAVSSARSSVFMGLDKPLTVVGERINPTGKKKLQAELREGSFALVRQYAQEQADLGANILDVNMGLSGIDENAMMRKAVALLSQISDRPLCIDTTNPDVMEQALRLYPGRALVNSISLEKERIEKTLPIAAKYGAMFVLLPLTDDGIPTTAKERTSVVEKILAEAKKYGYGVEDVTVDGLVMTISSEQEAASVTLDVVEWCAKTLKTNTIIGLSNVSFGLPQRDWVNSAFLAMAVSRGLSMTIANPSSQILMAMKYATDALTCRDKNMTTYVEMFAQAPDPTPTGPIGPSRGGKKTGEPAKERTPAEHCFDCVLKGDLDAISNALIAAMDTGVAPKILVDDSLIPAIQEVGSLFDQKKYFLPQLILSADTMRKGFEVLEPILQQSADKEEAAKEKIILATVKGDIHDIGKNIVGLMLRNYGFDVIDLGKDVAADAIIDAIRKSGARIAGLSALMTTTMTEMKEVIQAAKEQGIDTKFMVGGAVVDQAYADEIGADGYASDAMEAVRLAQRLIAG